jgi:hypothetical protein
MRVLPVVLLLACSGDPAGDATPDGQTVSTGEVWTFEELEPLGAGERWLEASGDVSRIQGELEAGTLNRSRPGVDRAGTPWTWAEQDDNGRFPAISSSENLGWLVAPFALGPTDRVLVRTGRTVGVWVGAHQQAGYVYEGGTLLPLRAREADSRVAVLGITGRAPTVQLYRTSAEVWLDTGKVTAPTPIVGDTTAQWLGVPVANLRHTALGDVHARVVDNDWFSATEQTLVSVGAAATTQLAFELVPKKAPTAVDEVVTVRLEVASDDLRYRYQRDVELVARAPDAAFWRTFVSPVDGSVQAAGIRAPVGWDPTQPVAPGKGLILSLHGAAVQAIGQAGSYAAKEWAWVVAPTNRHPFGFDWEEWGKFNAIATLDWATAWIDPDPSRVHLVGHSMGGHGTWHVWSTTPGRFASLSPSAGWESFYTYGGSARPTGAFERARAHSDTRNYLGNLDRRGVYVIHGDADDNVPVAEGRKMVGLVEPIAEDTRYHEEPGAGHWWDANGIGGADCVDLPDMIDWLEARSFDPHELDFTWRSPSPGYSDTHSVVRVLSASDPYADVEVRSERDDDVLRLTTTNVRGLEVDGAVLASLGVATVSWNGDDSAVGDAPLLLGDTSGKQPHVYGPFNQSMRSPFCFVYPDDGPHYQRYAAKLAGDWVQIGTGQACALPASALTDALRAERNLVFLGVDDDIVQPTVDARWGPDRLQLGDTRFDEQGADALLFVFPEGDRLHAVLTALEGSETRLYGISPYSSRAGLPDYLAWGPSGGVAPGMFGADWAYTPGR